MWIWLGAHCFHNEGKSFVTPDEFMFARAMESELINTQHGVWSGTPFMACYWRYQSAPLFQGCETKAAYPMQYPGHTTLISSGMTNYWEKNVSSHGGVYRRFLYSNKMKWNEAPSMTRLSIVSDHYSSMLGLLLRDTSMLYSSTVPEVLIPFMNLNAVKLVPKFGLYAGYNIVDWHFTAMLNTLRML